MNKPIYGRTLFWGFITVCLLILAGAQFFTLPDYIMNLFTEFVSLVATVGILNVLIKRRESLREAERSLQQLIQNAGVPVQSVAVTAATILYRQGRLLGEESVLKGEDLSHADWEAVHLEGSNLDGVILKRARLSGSYLEKISLRNGVLSYADLSRSKLDEAQLQDTAFVQTNLSGARLTYAKLAGAQFIEANLQGADLRGADLCGTDLRGANLEDAHMDRVKCDLHTTLPNGQKWSPACRWEIYTQTDTQPAQAITDEQLVSMRTQQQNTLR